MYYNKKRILALMILFVNFIMCSQTTNMLLQTNECKDSFFNLDEKFPKDEDATIEKKKYNDTCFSGSSNLECKWSTKTTLPKIEPMTEREEDNIELLSLYNFIDEIECHSRDVYSFDDPKDINHEDNLYLSDSYNDLLFIHDDSSIFDFISNLFDDFLVHHQKFNLCSTEEMPNQSSFTFNNNVSDEKRASQTNSGLQNSRKSQRVLNKKQNIKYNLKLNYNTILKKDKDVVIYKKLQNYLEQKKKEFQKVLNFCSMPRIRDCSVKIYKNYNFKKENYFTWSIAAKEWKVSTSLIKSIVFHDISNALKESQQLNISENFNYLVAEYLLFIEDVLIYMCNIECRRKNNKSESRSMLQDVIFAKRKYIILFYKISLPNIIRKFIGEYETTILRTKISKLTKLKNLEKKIKKLYDKKEIHLYWLNQMENAILASL